jgi:hypothetical protein
MIVLDEIFKSDQWTIHVYDWDGTFLFRGTDVVGRLAEKYQQTCTLSILFAVKYEFICFFNVHYCNATYSSRQLHLELIVDLSMIYF